MKKKKGLWITLIVLAALALMIFAVVNSMNKGQSQNAVYVKSGKAALNELKSTILTSGRIQPVSKSIIASEISGKIDAVHVKVGDSVKKGQVLAVIDASDIENRIAMQELKIKSAELNLKKIQSNKQLAGQSSFEADRINYEDAKKAYEQKKILFESGAISKADLDGAKSLVDKARAAYTASSGSSKSNYDSALQALDIEVNTLSLDELKKQLSQTEIRAEKDGVVTELRIKENDFVQATVAFGLIEDTQNLEMMVNINEFDIRDIQKGQRVVITAEGNNQEYEGEVTDIAPKAELRAAGQSYETVVAVTVSIKEPKDLKINFSANAEIRISEPKKVMTLSYDALTLRDGQNVIFKIGEDKKVKMVPVTLGIKGDIYVEVLGEDLKEGDKVVLNPGEKLKDGDQVKEGL